MNDDEATSEDMQAYRKKRSFRPKDIGENTGERPANPQARESLGGRGDQAACPRLDYGGRVFYFPWRGMVRDLTAAEKKRLRAEVRADGVLNPVIVDEFDNVIDGDNRLHIAFDFLTPIAEIPFCVLAGKSLEWKADRALKLNLARRHLTPEEQQKALDERAERKKADRKSTRAHAKDEGVSQKTAQRDAVREVSPPDSPETQSPESENAKLEIDGTFGTVTGLDGKQYPARKATPEAPKTCPRDSLKAAVLHRLDGVPLRELEGKVNVSESTLRGHWKQFKAQVDAHVEAERQRREAAAPRDEAGNVVPESLRDVFAEWPNFDRHAKALKEVTGFLTRLEHLAAGRYVLARARVSTRDAFQDIVRGRPYAVCAACKAGGKSCDHCRSLGFVDEASYKVMRKSHPELFDARTGRNVA